MLNHGDNFDSAGRPIIATQLLNKPATPFQKRDLAQLQSALTEKRASVVEVNRALEATIDLTTDSDEMSRVLGLLSTPERETIVLCAFVRAGHSQTPEIKRQFELLHENLPDHNTNLTSLVLRQVIQGWPIRPSVAENVDVEAEMAASWAPLALHFACHPSRTNASPSELDGILWASRACCLMQSYLASEFPKHDITLTSEAESGFRRVLSAEYPFLRHEVLSGAEPFHSDEPVLNSPSDTAILLRDIIGIRASFIMLQSGLLNQLERKETEVREAHGLKRNDLYQQFQSLREYDGPADLHQTYLRRELTGPLGVKLPESLEEELMRSVVIPFERLLTEKMVAVGIYLQDQDNLDHSEAVKVTVRQFCAGLAGGIEPSPNLQYIERELKKACVDLALNDFLHEGPLDTLEDLRIKTGELTSVLRDFFENDPKLTVSKILAQPAIEESLRQQLAVCLAEITLREHGQEFEAVISRELRDRTQHLAAEGLLDSPDLNRMLTRTQMRSELLRILSEQKPNPEKIVEEAVNALTENSAPLLSLGEYSKEARDRLKESTLLLLSTEIRQTIDVWCSLIEERINKSLELQNS